MIVSNSLRFSLCSRTIVSRSAAVCLMLGLKTGKGPGSCGTMNGVVDNVAYNGASMINPMCPCCPPPNVVGITAALEYNSVFMLVIESYVGSPCNSGMCFVGNFAVISSTESAVDIVLFVYSFSVNVEDALCSSIRDYLKSKEKPFIAIKLDFR